MGETQDRDDMGAACRLNSLQQYSPCEQCHDAGEKLHKGESQVSSRARGKPLAAWKCCLAWSDKACWISFLSHCLWGLCVGSPLASACAVGTHLLQPHGMGDCTCRKVPVAKTHCILPVVSFASLTFVQPLFHSGSTLSPSINRGLLGRW